MKRERVKKYFPIVLILAILLGFAWKFLDNKNQTSGKELLTNQLAEEMIITGEHKDYIASDLKIKPGFYDVYALSGEIEQFPVMDITKENHGKNVLITEKTEIRFTKNAQIKLVPSSFDTLSGSPYVITNSGYYLVGKQLPAGKYEVRYQNTENIENNHDSMIKLENVSYNNVLLKETNSVLYADKATFDKYVAMNEKPIVELVENSLLKVIILKPSENTELTLTKID